MTKKIEEEKLSNEFEDFKEWFYSLDENFSSIDSEYRPEFKPSYLLFKKLQSAHLKWNKEIREMINTNQKGTFTDDGGNDCWYIDDLNKALDQLLEQLGEKK